MSYTTDRQPQGTLKDPCSILRQGMIAEIVAIDDYAKFLGETENKEVKSIFRHIMEEEKHHYALFLNALRAIDPKQCELSSKIESEMNLTCKDKYKDGNHGKESKDKLLINIREAIKGELEAIVLYEDFLCNLIDDSLKSVILHIVNDEKEHVEELTYVLIIMDKDKYDIEHKDDH